MLDQVSSSLATILNMYFPLVASIQTEFAVHRALVVVVRHHPKLQKSLNCTLDSFCVDVTYHCARFESYLALVVDFATELWE